MKDKIVKRNNFIHFIEKWLIISLMLFILIQIFTLAVFVKLQPETEQEQVKESFDKFQEDYIGHWYNGTFFINMMISENFKDKNTYKTMRKEYKENKISGICMNGGLLFGIISLSLLLIAAYKERKNKLLEGKTPIIISLAGISILIYKMFEEIDLFIETTYYSKYATGFLKTSTYYPMIHNILIIPTLIITLGLLLRELQLKKLKKETKTNERLLKTIIVLIITIGLGFILFRLGIRINELIMTITNNKYSIRLPFYYYMFDLPRDFAINNSSYIKLVALRLIKDLPVFIASIISIIMFVKIIKSSINGRVISKENNKRYKTISISLLISSIIFNLLGLLEVKLYNSSFLYQYKEATYTIAIRSLSEPLLYAFFIYIFKHYIELANIKK